MSDGSGELRVSLRLQSGSQEGQLFENLRIQDTSRSLGDFLDGALKDLEVCVVYVTESERDAMYVMMCEEHQINIVWVVYTIVCSSAPDMTGKVGII